MQVKKSPVDVNGKLPCNAICEIIQDENKHSVTFSPELVEFAQHNLEFAAHVEKSFSELIKSSTMKAPFRKFIHELAQYYEIVTESIDPEPNRSVVAQKLANSHIPQVSIAVAVELKKRSLLKYVTEEELIQSKEIKVEETEKDPPKHPKLKKGFAKAIPVPTVAEVEVKNVFSALVDHF
ncbi:hypothetical protein HDU76_001720 [Blyttiomyces sp. JEL0837]|nr:hypothetical protein HDU76_001720 [Blyttiomyces sp. JEL0837]